jgi:hypothetical protein
MDTRFCRAILLALAAVVGLPSSGSAQTAIEIPQQDMEPYVKRFDLSTMSQEETLNLMGLMFRGIRGSAGDLTSEGVVPESSAPVANPTTAVAPAPQSIAVFPQIPPAVAGSKQGLGRWMMFQAELLHKIGQVYAQYGQELLQEAAGQTPRLGQAPKTLDAAKAADPGKTTDASKTTDAGKARKR